MSDVQNGLAEYYGCFLAAHIIAVIALMAGMLYLPRLFVYHAETQPGSECSEQFKVMERRLLKAIITPALIAVWVLGLLLAVLSGTYATPWLQLKFILVVMLTGLHGFNVRYLHAFARDKNVHSARFFRIANELPTVLMIFIVLLVVIKPFGR